MISNISFVIPVCNTEIIKFSRCINSIEKINIKNYEIIIVDDGSEEENTQKYRTFLKNHSNVKYFKNTNHGVSYSRNYGINNSTKKYIMFVDSDDYLLYESLNENDILLKGDIIIFNMINLSTRCESKYPFSSGTVSWKDLILDHIIKGSISSPCAKFYKKSFIKENNLQFNSNYVQGEDAFFNLEYLSFKPSIYYYNIPIYIYDYTLDSTISRWNKKFDQALIGKYDFYYKKKEILRKLDLNNINEILTKVENDFLDKTMHSYLILIKLNDINKINKYISRFKKERICFKKLNFKEKIYYCIMKSNGFVVRFLLKIVMLFKKI